MANDLGLSESIFYVLELELFEELRCSLNRIIPIGFFHCTLFAVQNLELDSCILVDPAPLKFKISLSSDSWKQMLLGSCFLFLHQKNYVYIMPNKLFDFGSKLSQDT